MKYLLFSGLLLMALNATAQFQRGEHFSGGSASLSTQNSEGAGQKTRYNIFNVTSFNGYFVRPNLALGMRVGYSSNKYTSNIGTPSETYNKQSSVEIGLTGRRFYSIADNFFFIVDGTAYYSFGKDARPNTPDQKTSRYGLTFSPGFVFFASPAWGLEANYGALQYYHSSDDASSGTSNYFGARAGGTLSIGLTYYVRKSK